MTLEEIIVSGNKKLLEDYYSALSSLKTSPLTKDLVDSLVVEPIERIWQEIFEEEQKYASEIFFPGDLAIMYPNIKERRAKKPITCDFSAGIIYPGSLC